MDPMIDRMRPLRWWTELNQTFWFVPAVMSALAVVVALVLVRYDYTNLRSLYGALPWIYNAGPEEARSMLSTIASSVMTVAGTTFSITIAALALASQQYGPRRLRSFTSDRGTQVVLGTYGATFLYCLIVLRSVHGPGEHTFVPHAAATLGYLFAIASVGVLIYFIHHIATSLEVEQLIDEDTRNLASVVHAAFERDVPPAARDDRGGAGGTTIAAPSSGYARSVDVAGLLRMACELDGRIEILARPGTFVVRGEPLLRIEAPGPLPDRARRRAVRAVDIDERRSATQDPLFGVQQLVEIAVRALSPAINAPYTAIVCIDRLGGVLAEIPGRTMRAVHDGPDGRPRVRLPTVSFAEMLAAAFDDVRRYGRSSPAVLVSLLEALGRIARAASDPLEREAVRAQVEAVAAAARADGPAGDDIAVLRDAHQRALDALEPARV
jgi:uncharacterized membrane protein